MSIFLKDVVLCQIPNSLQRCSLLTSLFAIVVLLTIGKGGAKTENRTSLPLCCPLTPETPKVNCFQKIPFLLFLTHRLPLPLPFPLAAFFQFSHKSTLANSSTSFSRVGKKKKKKWKTRRDRRILRHSGVGPNNHGDSSGEHQTEHPEQEQESPSSILEQRLERS